MLSCASRFGTAEAGTWRRSASPAVQALLVRVLGRVLGLAAGVALPSRRALLLVAATHMAAIELARFNVAGPTVDWPRFDSLYGVFDGGAELSSRRDLVLEWFEQLDAPRKRLFTFPDGGHSVRLEHCADLPQIMLDTVLPETYPQPSP